MHVVRPEPGGVCLELWTGKGRRRTEDGGLWTTAGQVGKFGQLKPNGDDTVLQYLANRRREQPMEKETICACKLQRASTVRRGSLQVIRYVEYFYNSTLMPFMEIVDPFIIEFAR